MRLYYYHLGGGKVANATLFISSRRAFHSKLLSWIAAFVSSLLFGIVNYDDWKFTSWIRLTPKTTAALRCTHTHTFRRTTIEIETNAHMAHLIDSETNNKHDDFQTEWKKRTLRLMSDNKTHLVYGAPSSDLKETKRISRNADIETTAESEIICFM